MAAAGSEGGAVGNEDAQVRGRATDALKGPAEDVGFYAEHRGGHAGC